MDDAKKIIQNKKASISLFFLVVSILVVSSGLIITVQEFQKSNNENNAAETEFAFLNNVGSSFSFESLDGNEGDDFVNSFLGGGGGSKKGNKENKECCKETIEAYNQEILEKIVPDKSPEERLAEINKKIKEKGAKWKAGLTPKALLSVEEKRKLLGSFMLPDKDDPSIKEVTIKTAGLSLPPSYFDWRNKDGENWMTSVKDQGSCGSCWAFSAVGAVEPAFNIYNNNPYLDLDLSEQQLVSDDGVCCDYCGNCERGGLMSNALYYIKHAGITDEACFPYTATTSPCNLCVNWEERKHHITNCFKVTPNTTETYKQALMNYGPLSIGIASSDMFTYYISGIYEELENISFNGIANHAVVLVGWNNTGNYWIIKNSWGTGGSNMSGYAKMAYGSIEKYGYVYAVELFIECYNNSDCGTDGYMGDLFCQDDNVWQDYTTYTCNAPGTFVANCSDSTTPELKENCGFDYCEDWQDNYCKDGDVYHERTCHDKGCSDGGCFNNSYIEEEKVDDCDFGCSDGECIECSSNADCNDLNPYTEDICNNPGTTDSYCDHLPIACLTNTDCGTNSYTGNSFCQNNDVWQDYITYTCNDPGISTASCSDSTAPKLIEECPNGCTDGRCKVEVCKTICNYGRCYEYCVWK